MLDVLGFLCVFTFYCSDVKLKTTLIYLLKSSLCVTQMSQFIVQCLNPYRKPDCKSGRISNTEDFKHLARKVS